MKRFKLFMFTLLSVMIVGIMNVNAASVKIGDVTYNTFEEAVEAVKSNEVIVLQENLDLTIYPVDDCNVFDFVDNVTIDLNNYTITSNHFGVVYQGNNLTIKNGEFITIGYGEPKDGNYALFVGDEVETTGAVLENLTLKGGVNVYNAKNVTLRNVISIGSEKYYSVWADENAEVIIESGSYSTNGSVILKQSDAAVGITVNGGFYELDVTDYVADGLTVKKIGEIYTVGKENTVTIGTVTAGKLEVDKTKAIVGETVTLTLTPNEGYELSKLEVKTSDGKDVEVKDNAFVMPNAAVTVTAVYTKVTTTAEIPVISETTEVEEIVVGVKEADKVEDILLESLKENEELAQIAEDKSVKVVVEIESVEESSLDEKVVEKMKEEAGKTTIAEFFDINILVKDVLDNSNLGNITELTEEIELMILLPEKLKNSEEGTTRKYYVVRHHIVDGQEEVELIDAEVSEDGNYLVFKTDKFSTYALAYEDVAATPNTPQTSDSIGLYIILGFISVAAIGLSLNSLKRRNSKAV